MGFVTAAFHILKKKLKAFFKIITNSLSTLEIDKMECKSKFSNKNFSVFKMIMANLGITLIYSIMCAVATARVSVGVKLYMCVCVSV